MPVLSRNSPKHLQDQNTSRTFPPLNKRSHSTTETLAQKLFMTAHRAKPVRPIWETGQTSFALKVGKNTARGKNSTLQAIDLPIRSTDQSETLGIVGVSSGLPLARSSVPKTHSIKRNRKSTLKNIFPWKPLKTPKLKPFRRVCWSKITKQRGTRSSYVTSNKNLSKKHPPNFPTEIPRKGSENHQKGKMGGTQPSLEEPRRIIYTYHERFIQVLAFARSSFPLTRSHHEALNLVLWKS
jgi:hypothetical protein